MQTLLIVVHLVIVIALVALILLQRSEGGALGIGGGGFMTGRGQANVLTRATAILAALFFITSLALTIHANLTRGPKSILDTVTPAATHQTPASPAGAPKQAPAVPPPSSSGTVLDELKKLEQQRQAEPAPQPSQAPQVPQVPQSQ